MRRGIAGAALSALLLSGCGAKAAERVVRVDFRHDEFASHYWRYFPNAVSAHPGDTIVFRQEWTGEPHTITFGTLVDEAVPRVAALEEKYGDLNPETASDEEMAKAEKLFGEALSKLPMFDPYLELNARNVTHPCYLRTGEPPSDHAKACAKVTQPAFDGTHAYYSSGFIPPQGTSGNSYRLPLAPDIEPGTYHYYCAIHFPDMQGRLVVKEPGEPIPSQSETNEAARKEIGLLAGPLRSAFDEARSGKPRDPNGNVIDLPIAGYHAAYQYTVAVDEFVPRTLRAKVNEPVTWTITGAHTISFDVPKYVPIYRVAEDGAVRRNAVVDRAAGGSPKPPPVDFTKGPVEIDGGTWDGSGFFSSGLIGSEPASRYTLRVSKAGRYRYACLVHPAMVGTLVVEP